MATKRGLGAPCTGTDSDDNIYPLPLETGGAAVNVNITGGAGGGGTSSTFGAAFPTAGTAIGISNGTDMEALVEGQALSAASLPVVIASDQSAIPVTSSAASQALATGNTKLLTVTHVTPVAITTVVACANVTVVEDNSVTGWPTTAFQISKPLSGSTAIQFPAGASYSFPAPPGSRWAAGVTVGYIILPATGSTSFSQDESA